MVGKIDKRCRKLSEFIGNAQFLTSQRERTRSVNGQPQRTMDGIFADIGIGTDEFELELVEIFELFGVKFNVCGDALTEVFCMYGQSTFKFPVQTQIELRTHGNQRRRRSPIEMQLSADDDFISPHRKLNNCLLTQSGERERIAWNTNREIRQTAEGCIGRNDRLSGLIGAVDHACERLHLRRFFMLGCLYRGGHCRSSAGQSGENSRKEMEQFHEINVMVCEVQISIPGFELPRPTPRMSEGAAGLLRGAKLRIHCASFKGGRAMRRSAGGAYCQSAL